MSSVQQGIIAPATLNVLIIVFSAFSLYLILFS